MWRIRLLPTLARIFVVIFWHAVPREYRYLIRYCDYPSHLAALDGVRMAISCGRAGIAMRLAGEQWERDNPGFGEDVTA